MTWSHNAICLSVLETFQHLGQNVFWVSLKSTLAHICCSVTHDRYTLLLCVQCLGENTPQVISNKMYLVMYLDIDIQNTWILQRSNYVKIPFFFLWVSLFVLGVFFLGFWGGVGEVLEGLFWFLWFFCGKVEHRK